MPQTSPVNLSVPRVPLRAVLTEYQMHYNSARPHQGIAQRVPGRSCVISVNPGTQQIRRKPILGGLINEYTQAA